MFRVMIFLTLASMTGWTQSIPSGPASTIVVHSTNPASSSSSWAGFLQPFLGTVCGALISLVGVYWKINSDKRQMVSQRRAEQQVNSIVTLVGSMEEFLRTIRYADCHFNTDESVDGETGEPIWLWTSTTREAMSRCDDARKIAGRAITMSQLLLSDHFNDTAGQCMILLDRLFGQIGNGAVSTGAGLAESGEEMGKLVRAARNEFGLIGAN